MTERDGLPRHPYPVLLPESGGFEEAIGRARSRRRRQVAEAAAMASVVAVFAGGFLASRPGPDNPDRLRQLDGSPQRDPDNSPAPSTGPPSPTPTATGDTAQQPVPGPGGNDRGGSRPTDLPSVGSHVSKRPEPVGRSSKYPAPRGAVTFDTECRTSDETEWCLRASADPDPDTGNRYSLTFTLCRMLGASDTQLTFPTEQEVDFEILLRGDVRWTWSKNQVFEPGERAVRIGQGECVAWTTRWDTDDEEGRLLKLSSEPGVDHYTLRARTTAAELGGRTVQEDFVLG